MLTSLYSESMPTHSFSIMYGCNDSFAWVALTEDTTLQCCTLLKKGSRVEACMTAIHISRQSTGPTNGFSRWGCLLRLCWITIPWGKKAPHFLHHHACTATELVCHKGSSVHSIPYKVCSSSHQPACKGCSSIELVLAWLAYLASGRLTRSRSGSAVQPLPGHPPSRVGPAPPLRCCAQ